MKYLTLLLIMSVSFACFSIADQSAVEIELPTDSRPLLNADNVKFSNGAFYFLYDNVTVIVRNGSVRVAFPVEEVEYHSCYGKTDRLKVRCWNGTVTTVQNGSTLFNAYFDGNVWRISLDYIQYPVWLENCVELPRMNCSTQKIPRVTGYTDSSVRTTVGRVLRLLNAHRVITLSESNISAIENVSRLGNAGHNGRIVWERGWKPYYNTDRPLLLRKFVEGGCGAGKEMDVPGAEVRFRRSSYLEKFAGVASRYLVQLFGIYSFYLRNFFQPVKEVSRLISSLKWAANW